MVSPAISARRAPEDANNRMIAASGRWRSLGPCTFQQLLQFADDEDRHQIRLQGSITRSGVAGGVFRAEIIPE
jgi:hypothetical protein